MKTSSRYSGRAKMKSPVHNFGAMTGQGRHRKQGYFGAPANFEVNVHDSVKGITRTVLDSGESVFFLRELEHIMKYVHEVEYETLKGRKFVPVNTEVPEGATNWTWRQFDRVGIARVIRDYSEDIARVDIVGTEFYNNLIVSLSAGFGYNQQEIRSAQYTGLPLDARRAATAAESIRRLEDDLIFFGDARTNLGGFINNANMTEITLTADGAGSVVNWSAKTADQILRDLNQIANTIVADTKEVEIPDTMIFPTSEFQLIATKRIGVDSNMTVLKYFLETNPYITDIDSSPKLVGAGAGGDDRVLCYHRDKTKLEVIIPMDIKQYEPEKRGLEYIVDMESRFGGVAVYKPLSMAYTDLPSGD